MSRTEAVPTDAESIATRVRPFTIDEVVEVSGLGEYTVRRAVKSGEIASIRLGRNIKIPAPVVRALLGIE